MKSSEEARFNKLRRSTNTHILRNGAGVNPTGDRLAYSVVPEDPKRTSYILKSTGYVALAGTENVPQNFHPSEPPKGGQFTIESTVLAEDFVAI